jgi:hypothetical protein
VTIPASCPDMAKLAERTKTGGKMVRATTE